MNRAQHQFADAFDAARNRAAAARREQDAADMAQLVTLTKALGVSRDYRKECWIAAMSGAISDLHVSSAEAIGCADKALAAFDTRFTPL